MSAQAIRAFVAQYKHSPRDSSIIIRNPQANRYWVQHKLALVHMTKLLQTASFEDRFALCSAMSAAERKVAYWERHANFNLEKASIVFNAARRVKITG
jgi:hypothetical protein